MREGKMNTVKDWSLEEKRRILKENYLSDGADHDVAEDSTPDDPEELEDRLVGVFGHPGDRTILERVFGQVWDTEQLQKDFEVQGFLAPFVTVTRKADGAKGSMTFQHMPRFYFDFKRS